MEKKSNDLITYKEFDVKNISVRKLMEEALNIARASKSERPSKVFGELIPSPMVGAVLLFKNKVYCAARSGFRLGDHAEFTVLEKILPSDNLKDAILFTTLEPCTPESRSPWTTCCSKLIVERGIKKIYVGSLDKNPLVTGKGLLYLQENGIEVQLFDKDLCDECYKLNEDFFNYFNRGLDVNVFKLISSQVHDYIDEDAVRVFLFNKEGRLFKHDNFFKININDYYLFYSLMIKERYLVYDVATKALKIDPSFVLSFFKNPGKYYHGFNFQVFPSNKNSENPKDYLIDSPLIIALNDKIKGRENDQVLYRLLTILGNYKNEDSYEQGIKSNNYNMQIIRELIVNAAVHSFDETRKNQSIKIIVNKNNIEVENVLSIINFMKANALVNKLNEYSMPSLPSNPSLMDLLKDSRIVEGMHLGMDTLKKEIKTKQHVYEIEEIGNIIELKATINKTQS